MNLVKIIVEILRKVTSQSFWYYLFVNFWICEIQSSQNSAEIIFEKKSDWNHKIINSRQIENYDLVFASFNNLQRGEPFHCHDQTRLTGWPETSLKYSTFQKQIASHEPRSLKTKSARVNYAWAIKAFLIEFTLKKGITFPTITSNHLIPLVRLHRFKRLLLKIATSRSIFHIADHGRSSKWKTRVREPDMGLRSRTNIKHGIRPLRIYDYHSYNYWSSKIVLDIDYYIILLGKKYYDS